MKFYKKTIILLFLLVLTMGAVCAQDANQTLQDTLEISDSQEVISNSSVKSFDDLAYDIVNKSDDTISLESDYVYQGTEKNKFIQFENVEFTINGNNHIIDANNKTSVFKVYDKSKLVIKNLVIRNCNDSAIIASASTVVTENVTFENCFLNDDYGAAIWAVRSSISSSNDKFIENYAGQTGASIHVIDSVANIDNATFKNKNPIHWSLISGSRSEITVENTVFENINSKYATAIYNTYKTTVKKSKFINLNASLTGGAVAVKSSNPFNRTVLTIEDCEFTNVYAGKNGGAVFVDINGVSDSYEGYVTISNSKFDSNFAEFGGAVLQLGGNLEIINTTFANNRALENGGAIYTSNATVTISKSEFSKNSADKDSGYGGAVFVDYGTVKIDGTSFADNVADKAGAVYSFNSAYSITNSEFKNNGEDIHTYFDKENCIIADSGNYTATINNKSYQLGLRYNGEDIILNPQPINGSAGDSYFNLRDLNLVTPVKNQGSMGACWAFGAAGAFESAFLIATGQTIDISENNIQNFGLRYSIFGNPVFIEGGNYHGTASYFLSWIGAIPTENDVYDELGKISSVKWDPHSYRVTDAVFINITDKKAIKEALTKYGALNLYMHGADSNQKEYYNAKTSSLYYYDGPNANHYVTLVGWNDTYSKNNFAKTPNGDGAWICKNSWGTDWGDEGYFYLSYYDTSLRQYAVGFLFENREPYEKLYQNEEIGMIDFNNKFPTFGHIFTSEGGDIISAVGSYFSTAGSPYTVQIFINNYLAYTQKGTVDHIGYNTIKLDKQLYVDGGSTFEVRITSNSAPVTLQTRAPLKVGANYVIRSDGAKADPSDENIVAPIKVYTYKNPQITQNIVKHYSNESVTVFSVSNYYDSDKLYVGFNGANYTIDIVNGSGKLSLGVLPVGSYEVTVYYRNATFNTQVVILTSIDSGDSNSLTLGYNAEGSFTVIFFDVNGTPLNKTPVIAKYDNKVIPKAITTAKGSLEITMPKNQAIGKHYLDFSNPLTGEALRVTVSVLSRFSGNANINMYYYDGHVYKVRIRGPDGKFVGKNKVLTIKIGKKAYKVKTDANGYAKLKIPYKVTPGKYTIAATYAGQTVKNVLNVKQVLKTTKTVKVKKSAKKLVLKATLKKGKTPLKGKVIKFNVNGKNYAAKTNKLGIAKLTIKKAAINKLKIKKYAIKVSYLSDVVKSVLIVRR